MPSYALIFKTHTWDAFIARQFDRYKARCRAVRLIVLVDETNGPVGLIPHDDVIRTTNAEILALGLANAFGKGGLLWWNTDYPNYLAFQKLPPYDYYAFAEYDTCVNLDIDVLIATLGDRGVDFLSQPTRQDKDTWYWTKFHEAVYPRAEMQGSLNCFSVFSRRAMQVLMDRRIAASREHAAGRMTFWPGNEVFVATEVARAGLVSASLEGYGDARKYEWHPPILEDDLAATPGVFLHPVLDRKRYIASVLKFEFDLSSYFFASSPLRRELGRFPARDYLPLMPGAFRRQMMVKVRQKMGAI